MSRLARIGVVGSQLNNCDKDQRIASRYCHLLVVIECLPEHSGESKYLCHIIVVVQAIARCRMSCSTRSSPNAA
jgi:hypothetical protein